MQLLTVHNELRFGTNLSDAIVCLANVDAIVGRHDIFDNQTFVVLFDIGPAEKRKTRENSHKIRASPCRRLYHIYSKLTVQLAYSHHPYAIKSAVADHRRPSNEIAPFVQPTPSGPMVLC